MIVVDSNVIAYLYLPTEFSKQAEQLLVKQETWAAPLLWRSEMRNILALYIRKNMLGFEQAYDIQTEAETLLTGFEYEVPSLDVLRLVENSACSAYDCEFVVLAKRLDTKLVTANKQLLKQLLPRG